MDHIQFKPVEKTAFHKELRKRVNLYFKENQISKTGGVNMKVKAVIMFSFLFLPFLLLFFIPGMAWYSLIGVGLLVGIGQSGIGLAVMHDACHASFFKKHIWNELLGEISMVFVGGFATNWKMQHNQIHHTYTNVHGMDLDIKAPSFLLRFSPYDRLRKVHKFQHLYAWFLYSLMSIVWWTVKDYKDLYMFRGLGFYDGKSKAFIANLSKLVLSRLFYVGFFIGLPLAFTSYGIGSILLILLMKHLFTGFALAVVFQPAHVMETSVVEDGVDADVIEEDWAIHQLKTTVNFGMKSKLLHWYIGGLNFQIEHHLFPNIAHVHYPKLSAIVQRTAKEFGIPYMAYPSFLSALKVHKRTLYALGRA